MSVSLVSPGFVCVSLLAIVLLGALRGQPRQLAFLTLNLVFVWVLLLGPVGATSTTLFVLLGFGLVKAIERFPDRVIVPSVTLFVVLFVYMRSYDFMYWLLPDALLTDLFVTVGLSFLLFKILHVMIEARSQMIERVTLLDYLNYCLNFTTFMMGPIQRFQDYADQWRGEKEAIASTFEAHLDAMLRILVGLTKAYVLGAWFHARALPPNADLLAMSVSELVVQAYAFYFFLYMNFAGYCDVAIGVGSLFGVRPPENFRFPFVSRNISDFWLRQHRSLTLWLTDYVFSPTFKRLLSTGWWKAHPLLAANTALCVTMLVSGLWHGTTLSFFLFGVAHGLCFVVYRTWDTWLSGRWGKKRVRAWRSRPLVHAGGIVITFNATAMAFIFFRVEPEYILAALRGLGL